MKWKPGKRTLWSLAIILVAIQFIPVNRSNPPVEEEVAAPTEVRAILKRACYDCHSNETRWPWYGRIAPGSWLMILDIKRGRDELNFSTWNAYSARKRDKLLEEAWEQVDEGEMPLWFYTPLHPEARISDADKALLRDWVAGHVNDSGD